MSKHKTRQQKIIAQLHRKLDLQQPTSNSEHITYAYTTSPSVRSMTKQPLTTISYIRHDLIKTSLVTFFIVAAEIVLYISLKTHLITLPIIGY